MAAGENPAAEMIKSVSLIIAGLLLLLPGFFTDFLGLLLLLPPVQKHLTVKLMPHLRFSRMPGGGFSAGTGGGNTFDGEYQRKDDDRDRLDHKDDRRGLMSKRRIMWLCHFPAFFVLAETAITPPA